MPSPWLAEAGQAPAGASRPSPFPSKGVPWWTRAFERAYLTVYGHRDEEEARRFAPHVARLLGLRHSSRILDLACGEGRYSRVLASLGFRMTGVDLSATLLEEAMRASPQLPGAPTYLRCDMRDLPFESQFEGVVSIFTSFGYFDDPADDLRVLRGVHRALVPGGRLLPCLRRGFGRQAQPAMPENGLPKPCESVAHPKDVRFAQRSFWITSL